MEFASCYFFFHRIVQRHRNNSRYSGFNFLEKQTNDGDGSFSASTSRYLFLVQTCRYVKETPGMSENEFSRLVAIIIVNFSLEWVSCDLYKRSKYSDTVSKSGIINGFKACLGTSAS